MDTMKPVTSSIPQDRQITSLRPILQKGTRPPEPLRKHAGVPQLKGVATLHVLVGTLYRGATLEKVTYESRECAS